MRDHSLGNDLEQWMVLDRYHATLLGCAVGDVLGIPVETFNKDQIIEFYGKINVPITARYLRVGDFSSGKIFPIEAVPKEKQRYVFSYGEYSDDTILTLSIAESIIGSGGINIEDIASKHVNEYLSRKMLDGKVAGGFGKTTIDALNNMARGVAPKYSGAQGPGAGPAMKISPVAIYANARNDISYLSLAEDISLMTYTDTRSVAGGIVQSHAIYWLLSLQDHVTSDHELADYFRMDSDYFRGRFMDYICDVCLKVEKKASARMASPEIRLFDKLYWIRNNLDASDEYALRSLGNGGASFECHPFSLFMFQKHWDDPIDGLIETVNLGGDSDTIGAIYGALCGAKNGMIFPDKLYSPIGENLSKIRSLAEGLFSFREYIGK
jgi:poly(ADP-ribose) glycohydrolase ARH3